MHAPEQHSKLKVQLKPEEKQPDPQDPLLQTPEQHSKLPEHDTPSGMQTNGTVQTRPLQNPMQHWALVVQAPSSDTRVGTQFPVPSQVSVAAQQVSLPTGPQTS